MLGAKAQQSPAVRPADCLTGPGPLDPIRRWSEVNHGIVRSRSSEMQRKPRHPNPKGWFTRTMQALSTSISHVWTGTTQAQAPFSCACACVVPVHTRLMLVLNACACIIPQMLHAGDSYADVERYVGKKNFEYCGDFHDNHFRRPNWRKHDRAGLEPCNRARGVYSPSNLCRGVRPTQRNPDPVQDTNDVNFATLSKRKSCNFLPCSRLDQILPYSKPYKRNIRLRFYIGNIWEFFVGCQRADFASASRNIPEGSSTTLPES